MYAKDLEVGKAAKSLLGVGRKGGREGGRKGGRGKDEEKKNVETT